MQELITLVDLRDRETGYCEKHLAHKCGKLHRAFSVFLFRQHGTETEMLIQKRSADKYHSGGKWANACCSHQRPGETLREAVIRRLYEELGVNCDVQEQFRFCYYHRFSEELTEYEIDHVFCGTYDGNLKPDPGEVEELKWVGVSELEKGMENHPDDYSVWFMIAAPRAIAHYEAKQNGSAASVML